MPLTVVLAVGMDSWKLTTQDSAWKSQGFIFVSAGSLKEAMSHFTAGDFDLVLLGHSISLENSERLTHLIRASGSHTPVVCVAGTSGDCHAFADATLGSDSNELITGMRGLLTKKAILRAMQTTSHENAA